MIRPEPTAAGNCDDLRLRVVASKLDDRLEALFFRHDDVHDHDIGRSLALQRRGDDAVFGRDDFVRITGEGQIEQNPNLFIIVYNQYSRHAPPAFFRIYLPPQNMSLYLAGFVPG